MSLKDNINPIKNNIQSFFKKVSSNDEVGVNKVKKKNTYLIVGVVVVLVLGVLLSGVGDESAKTQKKAEVKLQESVISDTSKDETAQHAWLKKAARDLDVVKEKTKMNDNKINETDKKFKDLLEQVNKTLQKIDSRQRELEGQYDKFNVQTKTYIESYLKNSKQDLEEYTRKLKEGQKDYTLRPEDVNNNITTNTGVNNNHQGLYPPSNVIKNEKRIDTTLQEIEETEDLPNTLMLQPVSTNTKETEKENIKEVEEEDILQIPPTSIIKGVLLSGFDAPTLTQAKTDPAPLVIKITDLSILANHQTQDLRSCFVLAEGYGDLASERAYIRTNTISCINSDNDTIIAELNAYVSDKDGKNGLRGDVVTKQGALIGRAIIAGFLDGIGKAFASKDDISTLDTLTGNQVTSKKDLDFKDQSINALGNGISSAATKLADFYLKMADQISPVIEISAGRPVDIIVTKVANVNLKQSKTLKTSIERTEHNE